MIIITFHAGIQVMECSVRIYHHKIQDCTDIHQVVCSSLASDRILCGKSVRRTNRLANLIKDTEQAESRIKCGLEFIWFDWKLWTRTRQTLQVAIVIASVVRLFVLWGRNFACLTKWKSIQKIDQKNKQTENLENLPVSSILVRIERRSLRLPI